MTCRNGVDDRPGAGFFAAAARGTVAPGPEHFATRIICDAAIFMRGVIFPAVWRIMGGTEGKSGPMTATQDQRRFEDLLHQHRRIVFKVAGLYSRTVADREDLVQEISVQLWRSYARYDERQAKFSTWLYRIALNVAISQARRQHWSEAERFEPLLPHHLDTMGGGETIHEEDERLTTLYAFIGQLDPLNRALILLYLEDRNYAEMAEILGISETNVATKISRIKQKLRGQMTATTGA